MMSVLPDELAKQLATVEEDVTGPQSLQLLGATGGSAPHPSVQDAQYEQG